MAEFASLQLEAKSLIDKIRRERSPVGHEKLALLLANALELLSNELYDSGTHFLLELIQNADDNSYTCSDPTLKFTYVPGGLRVDCNETGFTACDVESICSIRQSTKSGHNHSKGYIGEKGIGFKSVFRVADVVWISSCQYHFKFDKNEEFGMIAPMWDEFPEPTQPGYTSFYLRLLADYNPEELVSGLWDLDPALLIFLRRIRTIVLKIGQSNGEVLPKKIQRTDTNEGEETVTTLDIGDRKLRYLIRSHRVERLPYESRRPNYSHSDLVLAFPITDQPNSMPQNVYAFLPIGGHGLKFLLQGDFLLTVNRLNIDISVPWNQALRDALAGAFMRAVEHFNKGLMKYVWPYYVPAAGISDFFQPARDRILRDLAGSPVLESFAQSMARPSQLAYVELAKFADEDGQPFTLDSRTARRYLAANYPVWTIDSVCSLGVSRLSDQAFLEDLHSMISSNPEHFRSRSSRWHGQLAKALIPLTSTPVNRSALLTLCIIPLCDGKWVSATDPPVLFPGIFDLPDLSTSMAIPIVDPAAAADEHRWNLFNRLGVRPVDNSQMCQYICDAHARPSFNPEQWTRAQLVAHAIFLYDASWQPPQEVDLWFVTSENERCKGSRLYIRGDMKPGSPAARVFDQLETKFPIIHKDYLSGPDTQKNRSWYFVDNLHLSRIPRLVTPLPQNSKRAFILSEEFSFMFRKCRTPDVLHVLNENWPNYSSWIELDAAKRSDHGQLGWRDTLIRTMGDTVVETTIGTSPLRETVLPNLDPLIDEDIRLPVLKVDNYGDKFLRQRLSCFGVTVDNNIHYYLACLRAASDQALPVVRIISHVYEQIQSRYDGNEELVKTAFETNNFIYVPSMAARSNLPIGWLNVDKCLQRNINLQAEYPQSSRLFRWVLATERLNVGSLIAKATSINRSSKLEDIIQLFREINKVLRVLSPSRAEHLVKVLQEKRIFPVTKKKSDLPYDDFQSPRDADWFIADRPHLWESFVGKVTLLALDTKDVDSIDDFLDILRLNSRRLSKAVQSRTEPKGKLKFCDSHTNFFRDRAEFIKVLIPKSNSKRETIFRQLESARISTATGIAQMYTLIYRDVELTGRPDKGQVALSVTGEHLQLFIAEECLTSRYPSAKFIDLVAQHCDIKDRLHLHLLYAAFSEPSLGRIQATFAKQGFNVSVAVEDSFDETSTQKYSARSGDLLTIPPLFGSYDGDDSSDSSLCEGQVDGMSIVGRPRRRGENVRGARQRGRRLPMMNIIRTDLESLEDIFQPKGALVMAKWLDPNQELEYTGQRLTSRFFEIHLRGVYDPIKHWTSYLRTRAGLECVEAYEDATPFTMPDQHASAMVTKFLINSGHSEATHWQKMFPTYHFEVVVSTGGSNSPFVWSSSQLIKIQKFRLPATLDQSIEDVMILVRISDVFTNPSFTISVDPWDLFLSGRLAIQRDYLMQAVVREDFSMPSNPRPNHGDPMAQPSWQTYNTVGYNTAVHTPYYAAAFTSGNFSANPSWHGGETSTGLRSALRSPDYSEGFSPYHVALWESASSTKPRAKGSLHDGNVIFNEVGCHSQYSYRSLSAEEMRLLTLFPGEKSDALRGMICTLPFANAGQYRTLSYVWGPDTEKRHVLTTPDGTLGVRDSLYAALVRLRHKTAATVLWVDAICINQRDNHEKVEQIHLLPRIFQRATCTLAFLGADETSNAAIEMLLQIRAKDVLGSDSEDGWPATLARIPSSWGTNCMPPPDETIWTDVGALFNRSWFQRAWIVQEAVAAPTVKIVCGKWTIDWNDLYGAMEVVSRENPFIMCETADTDSPPWKPFLILADLREWEAKNTRWSLLLLLETFRHVDSSIKRDRFFALLGLACDGDEDDFEPDYESPFEVIALKLARALVAQGKGMQLLYRAGLGSQPYRFPSWVPDWTVERPSSLSESIDRGTVYNASGGLKELIRCVPETDELEVEGRLVDEIQRVSKSCNVPAKRGQYFKEVDSMIDSLDSLYIKSHHGVMKWKVPIAGALHSKLAVSGDVDIHSSYKAFRKLLRKAEFKKIKEKKNLQGTPTGVRTIAGSYTNEEMSVREKSMNYVSLLDDKIQGWKFVTTKKWGLCGIASNNVQVGDVVSIFNGGDVPFILRQSEDREGAYRLVGESYISWIMYGEALAYEGVVQERLRIH